MLGDRVRAPAMLVLRQYALRLNFAARKRPKRKVVAAGRSAVEESSSLFPAEGLGGESGGGLEFRFTM